MGWKDAPEVSAQPAWASAPEVDGKDSGSTLKNIAGGAIRGAGSIGATLLWPIDKATDLIKGDRGQTLGGLVTGEKPMSRNEQRRADMDSALRDQFGVDTGSLAFKLPKLATEIAGTAGAGGVMAKGAQALGAAPRVVQALQSAGFSTGGAAPVVLAGRAADLGIRSAAGAGVGAVSAGLVNPEDAGIGAAVGGALPGVAKLAGTAGNALGKVIKGPAQTHELAAAVQSARAAGYVIPPTQANASLSNRMIEGAAGKITTAQNASAKNAGVTADLAAKALGLPAGAKITPDALDAVRKEAGKAYAEVAKLPARPAVAANTLSNTPAAPAIDPAKMVFDLRKARNDATAWFRSYGRTADPDALVKAKTAAASAKSLETGLEQYAASVGRTDLVPAMKEARTLIAKTYSVEDALNAATGSIDAKRLASQLQKGKPLSGELKTAAEFAAQFPKAAQTVERMGSLPQTSPLDWAAMGTLSAVTQNPLMMAGLLARPAARAAALSPVVQNRLVQGGRPNALAALMTDPRLSELGYRAAPVLAADR